MRLGLSVIICFTLLAMSPWASCTSGSPDRDSSLAVYVSYPAGNYNVGSNVTTTVEVFREGAPFDPDSVTLSIGWWEAGRDIPITRRSEGEYTGTFTIEMWDIVDGDVAMHVDALDGPSEDRAMDTSIISVDASDLFQVNFDLPRDTARSYYPGEMVDVRVRFTHEGSLVDPDEGSLSEEVYGWRCEIGQFDLTRVSTGVYEGSFTIPPDCKESTRCDIWVYAEYTTDSGYILCENECREIIVDFYIIWAHLDKVDPDQTRLDMWVLDLENTTIEDADVVVNLSYEDSSSQDRSSQWSGTTDGNGMVSLVLEHPDVHPVDNFLNIDGYVESAGLLQSFSHYQRAVPEVNGGIDPEDALSVIPLDEGPLGSDSETDLYFRAYSHGEPLGTAEVVVYVRSLFGVHFSGTVETDVDGRFMVAVVTPPENTRGWRTFLNCYFQTLVATEWVTTSTSYEVTSCQVGIVDLYTDPGTTLTVELSRSGGTAHVTLDHPDADGIDEEAVVMWTLGDPTTLEDLDCPDWTRFQDFGWGWWGFIGASYVMCVWSDGAFHASFDLPKFLTEDVTVFVMGLVMIGPPDYYNSPKGENNFGAYAKGIVPPIISLPPMPLITVPMAGERYSGIVELSGTVPYDGVVERIEVHVDNGAWTTVQGTVPWTHQLDTTQLTTGTHTVEARAHDGERYSHNAKVVFDVDQPPSVTITAPANASTQKKAFEFRGTASDDVIVTRVESRLDGGTWTKLTGTTAWSWMVPTKGLKDGDHTLEVRVYDGYTYSEVASVTFTYKKPDEGPGPTAAFALLALVGAVGVAHLAMQRRRVPPRS